MASHRHDGLTAAADIVAARQQLAELYDGLDDCNECATCARGFVHVPGGGCCPAPRLMLIFINPTVRNITAPASWSGPRFPFAGKPKLWQILAETGWLAPDLPCTLAELGPTPEMVEYLRGAVRGAGLFVTNAVKCVDDGSILPAPERVARAWPTLAREVALVRPRRIVALGLIPFRMLTGRSTRLGDELWAAEAGCWEPYPSRQIAGHSFPVYPCYFPTGRGNPVGAGRMLASLHQLVAAEEATDLRDGPAHA